MVHEGGVRTVKVKGMAMDIAHHGPGFLKQTSGGGIIPEASPTLLRFGELEMTTGPILQGMAGGAQASRR